MTLRIYPFAVVAALSACNPPQMSQTQPSASATPSSQPKGVPASSPVSAATPRPADHVGPAPTIAPVDPAARAIALSEWRKSEHPDTCAPLALKSDAGAGGKPRRANFSGGWGVAFDQPNLRSAYGIAGTGFLPQHRDSVSKQRARLAAQWPFFRELEQLPSPSFAGYGIEGAGAYTTANPDGRGQNSLAYVRVGGQLCDYNVWSKLGRAHLELLLENLEILPTD